MNKPIDTMLILAIVSVPTAGIIAWLLGLIGAPVWVQLGLVALSVLVGMMAGALCWAARMGDER
jgi:hypothetical protein